MYTKTFTSAIVASLFASANAHFFISTPAPIPGSAPKDPLDPSGSNFPCHGADLSAGSVTSMSAGSDQTLAFDLGGGANTAVHGGGSCQLSVTYETDAAKLKDPASWKVIQSYVGGCPTNAKGNLDTARACTGSDTTNCVPTFSFKIPSEVKNGNAIMAWTWFNNIGNREMYMNCAKVSLSGGSGKTDSLPSMFVANLASINQCKTTENFNTDFPNPGAYVTKDATLNYPLKAPAGDCGSGSGSANVPSTGGSDTSSGSTGGTATTSANNGQYTGAGSGAGAGASGASAAPAAPAASSPAAGRGGQQGSNPGGVFAPGAASSAPVPTTLVTSAAPVATPTGGSSPAAAPAAAPASSGTCTNGQVSCPASGFYCIDATTFGMCAWGCATPQKVAEGTNCSNGAVVHAVKFPKERRATRHSHRRHLVAGSF